MAETEIHLHDWTGEVAAPLRLVRGTVKREWIDEYGHLNMAHYLTICDEANWAFWNWINAPQKTMEARHDHEYVIVENHVVYRAELAEGASFAIETQLTNFDDKRYVLFHRVLNADSDLAATNEVKCLGFDLRSLRGVRPRGSRRFCDPRARDHRLRRLPLPTRWRSVNETSSGPDASVKLEDRKRPSSAARLYWPLRCSVVVRCRTVRR
jgi:YbgC/YbaW family acyl-CoA thioester hydrolase